MESEFLLPSKSRSDGQRWPVSRVFVVLWLVLVFLYLPVMSDATEYYCNGQQANIGSNYYYPNGKQVNIGSTYYHDTGVETDKPPRRVTYRKDKWTFRFPVGQFGMTSFSVEVRYPNYILTFEFSNGRITNIDAECVR